MHDEHTTKIIASDKQKAIRKFMQEGGNRRNIRSIFKVTQ
jgi:hypothetical protein